MASRAPKQPYVCVDRGRYYVRGLPAGISSPGGFDTRAAAEAWLAGKRQLLDMLRAEDERTSRTKVRACMTCTKPFESEGPHNRMCPICRRMGSAEGSPVGYSFGSMTGRRKSA